MFFEVYDIKLKFIYDKQINTFELWFVAYYKIKGEQHLAHLGKIKEKPTIMFFFY